MAWSVLWQHHVFAVFAKKKNKNKNQKKACPHGLRPIWLLSCFVFWFNTSSLSALGGNEKGGYCGGRTAVLRTNVPQMSDEGPLN